MTTEYPPFPGGGIGTANFASASQLAADGHEVHVVTNAATFGSTAAEHSAAVWCSGRLTVHRVPVFDEAWQPHRHLRVAGANPFSFSGPLCSCWVDCSHLAAWHFAEEVLRLHRERPFDVVESPDCMASAFYLLRRRLGGDDVPAVVIVGHGDSREVHESEADFARLGYPGIRLRMQQEEHCVRHADALMVASQYMLDIYRKRYGDRLPRHVEVVPYYLDVPAVHELPSELVGIGRFVAAIGRLEPRKGTDLVLRAFAVLARKHPDLRLVLVGAPTEWREGESLEAMFASCLPLEFHGRVLRLGRRPRAQVFAIAQAAAVVLHAARYEVYPNAVLEAMAAGGAVVASEAGGQAHMIESGRSGFLVPVEDATSLAAATERLLGDAALAAAVRVAAVARATAISAASALTAQRERLYAAIAGPRVGANAGTSSGLVVIDAQFASAEQLAVSWRSLQPLPREWRGVVLVGSSTPTLPAGIATAETTRGTPWSRSDGDTETIESSAPTFVLWLLAGVELAPGAFVFLRRLAAELPEAAALLPWLDGRTADAVAITLDVSLGDLLLEGTEVPAAFWTRYSLLRGQRDFAGLGSPELRLVAMLARCLAQTSEPARQTGKVLGRGDVVSVRVAEDVRRRSVGNLERFGLAVSPWTTRAAQGNSRR